MKIFVLFIVCSWFTSTVVGQEIEFFTTYARSTEKMFQNNLGVGLGYNQYVNSKNRIGILVSLSFSSTKYDDSYSSDADPTSLYIKHVNPRNKRLVARLNYAFSLLHNSKSQLYLGPEIGLNYFWIKEQYERIANGHITAGNFSSVYSRLNKFGIGFLFEFKKGINKYISTYISIHPEITGFERLGTKGSHEPALIGWLNLSFGIRYSFIKKHTR